MPTQVGSLYSSLTLESASFISGMKKAADQTAKSTAQINERIGSVVSAAKAFTAVALGSEVFQLGQRALDYASGLAETAQQLGVTSDELQIYRYAASQVGIEQESMDKGLAKLTQSIGKAAVGSKAQASAFAALGISVRDANGNVKTAGDVIPEIAEALEKVKSPAERAAVEVALFGKAGQQLDNLLSGGRAGVDGLANAARRLGLVLSSEQIQKADDAADKLSAVKQVLEARIAGVVADNAGSILEMADALERLAVASAKVTGFLSDNARDARTSRFNRFIQPGVDWLGNQGMIGGFLKRHNLIAPDAAAFEAGRDEKIKSLMRVGSGALLSADAMALARPARRSGGDLSNFLGVGGGGGSRAGRSSGGGSSALTELHPYQQMLDDQAKKIAEARARYTGDRLDGELELIAADKSRSLDSLFGKATDVADALDGWKQPLIDFADEARSAAPAMAFLEKQVSDGLEGSRAAVTELGEAIDRDLIDGLHDAATGFGSLSDVALRVIDDIGRALITQLSPSGSGSIGNVIAGAIIGGLGHKSTGGTSGGGGVSKGLGLRTPGFATGGTGIVGGTGPADSKLVSMRLTPGELVDVRRPGNDNGRAPVVHQTIQFSGAVDVATRAEVYRVASAVKQSTIEAMDNRAGRRG